MMRSFNAHTVLPRDMLRSMVTGLPTVRNH